MVYYYYLFITYIKSLIEGLHCSCSCIMAGNVVRAAGLVVYRRDPAARQVQYLLMQTSYGRHHWSPPKGILKKICSVNIP